MTNLLNTKILLAILAAVSVIALAAGRYNADQAVSDRFHADVERQAQQGSGFGLGNATQTMKKAPK